MALSDGLEWHDAADIPVSGQAWAAESAGWARLPGRAKSVVRRAVWKLGRQAAGLHLEFSTDTANLSCEWEVASPRMAIDYMPATAVSGLDLYEKRDGRWRWAGVARPRRSRINSWPLFAQREHELRHYRLYLPLHNQLVKLRLGVDSGAAFHAHSASPAGLCIYGSSIVQGCCASRPGMAYPAILGRLLGMTVINLGFAGNARAEVEMADLLGELQPPGLVIDCLPNVRLASAEGVLRKFFERLAKYHARTPTTILDYPDIPLVSVLPDVLRRRDRLNVLMREAVARLVEPAGLPWRPLRVRGFLGSDQEATVDGLHPTDLGFVRFARRLAACLGG